MSDDKVDLSISIVNTSNWKYLDPCIDSIFNNVKTVEYEVLVVDNYSDDESAEKIKQKYTKVKLTENKKRYGFAKNNNINIKKAIGKYIMLLNDDTLVLPNSIEKAVSFLDNHPDIGVVGLKMISPNGEYQKSSARNFRSLISTVIGEIELFRRKIDTRFVNFAFDGRETVEIDIPLEAGMIVRKKVVDNVGCLDEQFFMFGEGADWCRRIKRAGWKIVLLLDCPIIHFGGTTNQRANLKMYLQSYKSTYLYFRKENPFTALIL